jgi:flagellar biosynthesis/type III secretory pathway protein FliH
MREFQERGLKKGLEEGLQKGLEEGRKEGMKAGIQEGIKEGIQEGKKEGIEEGKKSGKKEGLMEGLRIGLMGRIQLCERLLKTGPTAPETFAAMNDEQLNDLATELEKRVLARSGHATAGQGPA